MGGLVGGSGTTVSGPAGLAGSAVNVADTVAFVATVFTGPDGILKKIRDAAKAKKALAIANAGGYNTLTPYQKSLIPEYQPPSPIANLLSGSGSGVNGILIVVALVVLGAGLLIWVFKKH